MNRQLRYLRERVVNALDMLRKGEFKSILVAVWKEFVHRFASLRSWWIRRRQFDEEKIPGSAYVDWRKLNKPGYRPTVCARAEPVQFQIDGAELASDLKTIIGKIKVTGKRS